MRTVQEVKGQTKEVVSGIETVVRYGETEVVAYVSINSRGHLLVIPQVHAEYIQRLEIEDVGLLADIFKSMKG